MFGILAISYQHWTMAEFLSHAIEGESKISQFLKIDFSNIRKEEAIPHSAIRNPQSEKPPTPDNGRSIIHLDMDAYFASVEQRDCPSYRGKPLAVCHSDDIEAGQGIISAASYEARKFGLGAGMTVWEARKLCPHLIMVQGNYSKYLRNTEKVIELCHNYTDLVEVYSIDEMFLDVTGCRKLLGEPVIIAGMLQADISKRLGLPCSLGIGANKLVAKMASEFEKPRGITRILPEEVPDHFFPLPVKKLFGVGRRMERRFSALGISTIGDLAALDPRLMKQKFGVMGLWLHQAAWGKDSSRVVRSEDVEYICSFGHSKSIQGKGSDDLEKLTLILLGLTDGVTRRMRKAGYTGRTASISLCLGRMFSISRSKTSPFYMELTEEVFPLAKELFMAEKGAISQFKVTNIGVRVSGLKKTALQGYQPHLFEGDLAKNRDITKALDKIKDTYGDWSIKRCSLLHWKRDWQGVKIGLNSRKE